MTRVKIFYPVRRTRGIWRFLTRALILTVIAVMLTTQVPALPRPIGQLLSESRDSFKFWLHSSGLATKLSRVIGQGGASPHGPQEKQSDRDAKVDSIKIFPGDVTMTLGEREFFAALAYDRDGQQVGGVKFKWRADDPATKKPIKLSQTGEFVPTAAGAYAMSVQGAGHKAEVTVTVVDDPDRPTSSTAPVRVTQISSRDLVSKAPPPVSSKPHIAVEIEDPGWDSGNYPAAGDPGNDRGDPPGRPLHHGAGTGNFQISAPVLSLPGRGIDISLALTYNSRVWTLSNSDITYDIDRDWPAPGWSFGFGRVAGLGTGGAMIIDADGTRHGFAGSVTQYPGGYIGFTGHTTDGTFIDYNTFTDNTGTINYAQVKMPNGTVVQYGAPGRGAVYPQLITDANGNYINIGYRFNPDKGPKILFVTDTLGRTINFYYEGPKLTAITAPGLAGGERELVRLHYKTITLNYGFSSTRVPHAATDYDVLDAIYYPGTATGYWFGDSDSYSGYGMLTRYSEQRGMGFSATALDVQGTVTAGTVTKQCVYNYPTTPDFNLTDAPKYTTLTETWDGMDTGAAITTYLLENNGTTRSTTITFPDTTKSVQLAHKAPGQFNDGYIYEDSTTDSNNNVLRKSTVTWASGDYDSARPLRIEAFDELLQKTAAEFDYGPFNQVTTVRDYDYGGVNLLRTTRVTYRNAVEYTGRHIFNLVRRVDVWNASDTVRVSRIEYGHDGVTLSAATDVTQHNGAYDPNDPEFYDPATDFRGNVTSTTRYADAANLTGAITESRTYDITGNMVTASTSCCEQMSLVYSLNTQFTFPESQTRGSADPQSPARITTSAIYNFNTGLTTTATDANGRPSQASYFAATLRPQTLTLPTLASTTYGYSDTAMSVTETVQEFGGVVASQNVKTLNGLGQIKSEQALGQNGVSDYVDTRYDAMGRLWKQTRPYRIGETQQWTENFYDLLGRLSRVLAPDNSESRSFFNETSRPDSASALPGQTTRVVDAWGRERWARLDADGRLVEVVEPNPSGGGSVSAAGSLVTTYIYDTLGNLTQVNQGNQQRLFKYDSLSRLTNQKLAEESATLNNLGQYVGAGTWSEAFTYDERSNLITQTDARGVKTIYSYNSDPLNRLQSVSYDTSGFGDTGHLILAAASVTYEYMTTGDKTRLFRVTTGGVSTDEYGYDGEGRVNSRTLTMTSRPAYPMVTDYIYDTLNRVSDVRYPAQYGMAGNPRKVAHHDYDVSSRLTGLKVDNADYASQIVYNAASQTTSLKVGAAGANQITESYSYADSTGLLSNQTVQRGTTTLLDLSYDYLRTGTTSGRTGQLTKILNNLNHGRDRGYVYDALGRLTTATGGQPATWTQQYVYDRYGNRTGVAASGTTGGGTSLSPPTNLTSSYTGSGISLNWTPSSGAHHYQIERRSAGNPAFQSIGTSTGRSYTDSTAGPGAAYVYRVRAADAQNNVSGSSNARLAVARTFTDPALVSGVTLVKAAHVTELREAIDAVRTLAGSPQASWSAGVAQGQTIFAVQVEETRAALTPALQALNLTVPGFTDPQLFQVTIKKLHIEELRAALNTSGAGDSSGGGSSPIPVDGLASVSYNSATNRINTAGWEYDAAGNQTRVQRTDGSWHRHVYDAAGRLVKVQNDSSVTQVIHTYGASNHRLIEQVGNESSNQRTYYAWAGDSVIAEYEETAAAPTTPRWVKSYVYLGGRLLATIAPNGVSERVEYQHPDRLGTRLVTNNQDTTSFEQAALPFGTALDAESTGATKRRFTSYDRSSVSGLDYAVNRHYDPLQGRFTQVDPIGMRSTSLGNPQTLNLYAYCADDPINHTDPSGLGFFSFLGKIFGAIGKALHFIAKVLAVVAVVFAVLLLAWHMPAYAAAFAKIGALLIAAAWGPPIVGKLIFAVGGAAIRSRVAVVAGTPPINPSRGTGVGPISSFQQGQGPQIGAAPRDKTSWFGLVWDWFFNSGEPNRQFGPDASLTKNLRKSPGVDRIRREYCQQLASGGRAYLEGVVKWGLGLNPGDDDGVFRTFSMTRQVVGSFRLTVERLPDGRTMFTAYNETSLKSLLYHIPGVQNVKRGEGPGATMSQTYFWWETDSCGNR
jgi:RHS repeat-associated protein